MENIKQNLINIINGLDENKLKEVLTQLVPVKSKEQEMSDFLFSKLKEMTCKITGEKEVTYYDSDGKWFIQQDFKNEKLYVSYNQIWVVFRLKYGLNDDQIKDFISSWVETNLGWKGLIPFTFDISSASKLIYRRHFI
jgi:hypothetical protein